MRQNHRPSIVSLSICLSVCVLIGQGLVISPRAWGAQFRAGQDVQITGKFDDPLFASGGALKCTANSSDSLYLSGGQVRIDSSNAERVFAAGGTLSWVRTNARFALLAAGNLEIDTAKLGETLTLAGTIALDSVQIGSNWLAAAGTVRTDETSRIQGDSLIAAGHAALRGAFQGDVRVWANEASLNGLFSQDVQITAEEITLEPQTEIRGDFRYSAKNIVIKPGAKILGQRIEMQKQSTTPSGVWIALGITAGIFFFLGLLAVPVILYRLFPQLIVQISDSLNSSPWENLGKGLGYAVLGLLGWFTCLLSVVGTPLAIASIPIFAGIKLLAMIATFHWVGCWSLKHISAANRLESSKKRHLHGMIAVGIGVFAALIVSIIPWLGRAVLMLAYLAAFGATLKTLFSVRKKRNST